MSVLMAQGTEPDEIAQVAIDILRPHKRKNLITNPKILFRFADEFLGHFITDDTLPKVVGKVGISITLLRGFKMFWWRTLLTGTIWMRPFERVVICHQQSTLIPNFVVDV